MRAGLPITQTVTIAAETVGIDDTVARSSMLRMMDWRKV